jgi:small ligand-binding sensory domain FIST
VKWASAISERAVLEEAVQEVADDLLVSLEGHRPDLIVVFISPHFGPEYGKLPDLLDRRIAPDHVIGCSAGGVIGAGHEVEKRPALSVTAAILPDVTVHPFRLEGEQLPDLDAGPAEWRELFRADPAQPTSFIVIGDPFTFPAIQLLEGLDFAYPGSVTIGGMASAAIQPGGNGLFLEDAVFTEGAIGVSLQGNVHVDTVVAQGCRPIGQPMAITECRENVIMQMAGRPPLEVLQDIWKTLNDRDRALVRHSLFLGVVMDGTMDEVGQGDFLIRNIIGVDKDKGALAVGDHLRPGLTVQFHLRDAHTSSTDLVRSLEEYMDTRKGELPEGALLFSCQGRGEGLYGRPDHDTEAFAKKVGPIPLGGAFLNGEIGPVAGSTYLHGYTSAFGIFRTAEEL